MISLSAETAFALCSRLAGVWIVISSAERLVILSEFKPKGAYDPRVNLARVSAGLESIFRRLSNSVRLHASLLSCRLVAGIVLIFSPDTTLIMTIGWMVVAATTLLTTWLLINGGEDGSHQMLTIISAAFSIALISSFSTGLPESGLYFVGAQSCLAYGTAGVAKLISPVWRSGEAIKGVLSTRTHGIEGPAIMMQRHSLVALGVCWATILFEVCFILAPLAPQSWLIVLFAVAAIFHLMSACAMGLNGFFWSFTATYPAIFFLNQSATEWLRSIPMFTGLR